MKQYLLITGGAGYIGSHTVKELIHRGYSIVVVDRSTSTPIVHEQVVYVVGDLTDIDTLKRVFTQFSITAVIHCAGLIEVGASVLNPHEYYHNNVLATANLLHAMHVYGVKRIIFSSTAAVYGIPIVTPIPEEHPLNPLSPYGNTKYTAERMIKDYAHAYGLQYVIVRYFNAAGATPEARLGELHIPETHLIPRLLQAAYEHTPFTLWGTDYPTPDGTCIRDYVHVRDIAHAHYLALEYHQNVTVNLGTMRGHSVQEIITCAEHMTGSSIHVERRPRRDGDAPYLVADARRAYDVLAWQPRYSDMDTIMGSAWQFFLQSRSVDTRKPSIVKLMHTH